MMEEEWRTIFGFPLYEMNTQGVVRKKGQELPLRVSHERNGIPYIRMRDHITHDQYGRGLYKLYRETFPELAPPKTYTRRAKS